MPYADEQEPHLRLPFDDFGCDIQRKRLVSLLDQSTHLADHQGSAWDAEFRAHCGAIHVAAKRTQINSVVQAAPAWICLPTPTEEVLRGCAAACQSGRRV